MCAYPEKTLTLVERKKLQWAREREELERLNAYWCKEQGQQQQLNHPSNQTLDQTFRGRNVSMNTKYEILRRDSISSNSNVAYNSRRTSLPPLQQQQQNHQQQQHQIFMQQEYQLNSHSHNSRQFSSSFEKSDREMGGGETSGYGSDNPNVEEHLQLHQQQQQQLIHWNKIDNNDINKNSSLNAGYESSSSNREDRPKWGDRGVHLGKFWEPKEEDMIKTNDPPGWVKRGLERKTELIVSNMSPAESPEQQQGHILPGITQEELNRPCTTGSNNSNASSQTRSFIRGQNAPVEPSELAERERKRQIALAHQEAIRQQLEERERTKLEEKQRKQREEQEEEQRIKKQQQLEDERKERERKQLQEKLEREKKRKEAMQQAIEEAAKKALQEKQQNKSKNNNNQQEIIKEIIKEQKSEIKEQSNKADILIIEDKDKNKEDNKNLMEELEDKIKKEERNLNMRNFNLNNLINEEFRSSSKLSVKEVPPLLTQEEQQEQRQRQQQQQFNNNNNLLMNHSSPSSNLSALNLNLTSANSDSNSNLALVLQTPMETLQNMQFAVLMPNGGNGNATALPIAVPIALSTHRSDHISSSPSTMNSSRTENRILTPSQYRISTNSIHNNKNLHSNLTKKFSDSATQTDFYEFPCSSSSTSHNQKINNLGGEIANSRMRMSRQERVEERPKWNANRPPTRYLKQSEKDPLYLRRKRQKQRQRQMKDYEREEEKTAYSVISSDESQEDETHNSILRVRRESPRSYSRKRWKKQQQHQQKFMQRERNYHQTEILPVDSDKDGLRIYYKSKLDGYECCCNCQCNKHLKIHSIHSFKSGRSSSPEPPQIYHQNHNQIQNNNNQIQYDINNRKQMLPSLFQNPNSSNVNNATNDVELNNKFKHLSVINKSNQDKNYNGDSSLLTSPVHRTRRNSEF